MKKVCLNCRRSDVQFPFGRPRKNGVRVPMTFCRRCLALPRREHGGTEAADRAKRDYELRRRRGIRPALVGPAQCRACSGEDLWWDGKVWRNADGYRHVCRQAVAA